MSSLARFLAVFLVLVLPAAVSAQNKVPAPRVLETLVKASLLSLNDAIVTGNYTVFHAKLSKPFRQQFPPEKLEETFKPFAEKGVDFAIVASYPPTYDPQPSVDGEGRLLVKGYFPTEPSRFTFDLKFIPSDGEWKLLGVNVNVQGDKEKDKKP